ncbi:UNVERIFIED_ORG: hypothetical protein FHW05_002509 [Pantoea agglomerans]
MSITHCNFNICMAKNPLKHKNITSIHHEMRSESVSQYM